MATHEQHQGSANISSEEGHDHNSENGPDHQRVPFPLPDVANHTPGMMAQVFNLSTVERNTSSVKEVNSQIDERDQKKNMEGCDDMHTDLRCKLIKAEHPCKQNDDQSGDAHRGVDPKNYSQRETPSHATGRDASP